MVYKLSVETMGSLLPEVSSELVPPRAMGSSDRMRSGVMCEDDDAAVEIAERRGVM
jgi:hypothetical protein